jgi:hypothetical protein
MLFTPSIIIEDDGGRARNQLESGRNQSSLTNPGHFGHSFARYETRRRFFGGLDSTQPFFAVNNFIGLIK